MAAKMLDEEPTDWWLYQHQDRMNALADALDKEDRDDEDD